MGLFDGILGNVVGAVLGGSGAQNNPLGAVLTQLTGGNQAQGSDMLSAVLKMVQQGGGLDGVLGQLRANGLGKEADSWVGTGNNLQVNGDTLTKALGPLVKNLGLNPSQSGNALSQLLPEVINQLTPQGRVPDNHGSLLTELLGQLQKR